MYEYPEDKEEETSNKQLVKSPQISLQKVLWYVLVGLLMALSSGATALTKTVIQDHTSIAVLAEELHQLHQDMEDIKSILKAQ